MPISREIISGRRSVSTPVFGGSSAGQLNQGRIANPNHTPKPNKRRSFSTVVHLADEDGIVSPAVAGCSQTGVVTVYNLSGSIRWSASILSGTRDNHDITFDSVGGIWARNGDGLQLVHTDAQGNILSDTAIGSIYSSGSQPAIDHGPNGVAYSNQLSVAGVATPTVLATGPSGDLLSTAFNTAVAPQIGITAAGKIVGWGGSNFWVWDIDGTLLVNGDYGSIVPGTETFQAAAVSPTGDYLHFWVYSHFYSSVYSGRVNLTTGVVSSGTDTLLSSVTAAWCTPAGTPVFGTNSLAGLPGSSFPSSIRKIDGGVNSIVVAAGKIELWRYALGNYSLAWSTSTDTISCAYFAG